VWLAPSSLLSLDELCPLFKLHNLVVESMSKTYVVIGGTSGIGLAASKKLLADGHRLYVSSRNKPSDLPSGAIHFVGDAIMGQFPTVEEAVDGLVYCPGTINLKPFTSLSMDDFKKDWEINFLGAVRSVQHFLPQLKASTGASVVLISSVAATCGMPYHASIGSAKSALEGLVRALAAEFAPTIRVNGVAPSITQTPLASFLLSTDIKVGNALKRHPLSKIATAEEVASMICFLLSDDSSLMTGRILFGDGGLSNLRLL
jgi:3-oxoacyl-[acyl-carrier protein] reductase